MHHLPAALRTGLAMLALGQGVVLAAALLAGGSLGWTLLVIAGLALLN